MSQHHGIHEASGASLPSPARQIHCIVDDSRCRDAGQMKQLIGAQAKHLEYLWIQAIGRSLREMSDEVVERRSPPLNTDDDFRGEGFIAIVAERASGVSQTV